MLQGGPILPSQESAGSNSRLSVYGCVRWMRTVCCAATLSDSGAPLVFEPTIGQTKCVLVSQIFKAGRLISVGPGNCQGGSSSSQGGQECISSCPGTTPILDSWAKNLVLQNQAFSKTWKKQHPQAIFNTLRHRATNDAWAR